MAKNDEPRPEANSWALQDDVRATQSVRCAAVPDMRRAFCRCMLASARRDGWRAPDPQL